MLEATLWGLLGGGALVLGAVVGLTVPVPARIIGLIMGFGAGVLISAAAFDLTQEAFEEGGATPVVVGLVLGALTFYAGDRLVDRRGGGSRKRSAGVDDGDNGAGLALGALLDGIPESLAIGLTTLRGGGVSLAFVVAVFLSNVPESLSSTTGMRRSGHSARYVLALWGGVALTSGLAALAGYAVLGDAGEGLVAGTTAFAAGAILTMLADTMMPEAFAHSGAQVGLLTVLGFSAAFLLTALA